MTVHKIAGDISTAVIIGAGNVAWHLGHCLINAGIHIEQICNRTLKSGRLLAEELGAGYTDRPEELVKDADITIIAISDDAIMPFLNSGVFRGGQLVVHTAGTVDIDVFRGHAEDYGVMYPLQTLTRGKLLDFRPVPLLIEANNEKNLKQINRLASKISEQVHVINSGDRLYFHLAGVFCANFSNHLYALSDLLLQERGLTFDLLRPIILETARKAISMSPAKAQTGPASRGNKKTMKKHLSLLENKPQLKEIYKVLSESIMSMKK